MTIGALNRQEWTRQVAFLRNSPRGIAGPALFASGEHNDHGWLVRDYVPGRCLLELIQDGSDYDSATILRDVLAECAALERAGLYHRDVRLWNVIVRPDGHAALIDFGAIGPEPVSLGNPRNLFAAFLIFAGEVFDRMPSWGAGTYLPRMRLALPAPFGPAFAALLRTPPERWSFAALLEQVDAPVADRKGEALDGVQLLLTAAEESATHLLRDAAWHRESVTEITGRHRAMYDDHMRQFAERDSGIANQNEELRKAAAREAALAEDRAELQRRHEAALREHDAALQEHEAMRRRQEAAACAREAALRDELAALRRSASWRVTAPLRSARRMLDRRRVRIVKD
jgi:O-antigen chain-terminating methyltransferase